MAKKKDIKPIERTRSIEDFLKVVYQLQRNSERVRTSAIAEAMNITAPSAHDFINRCREAGLLDYISHHGVRLTNSGERIALEVLRHHRLLELYLVEALGYSWDEVHEEADALEHHISEKLEARIAAYLGNPTIDPHGDPIPDLDGTIPDFGLCKLADLPLNSSGVISRLLDQNPDNLRYLDSKGLVLGATVQVVEREPYDGLTHIEVNGAEQVIGETTAQFVMVKPQTS
ncbi:MAG TPA: metal-dependent transcriptional regulator [Aggregatilineales bacterium]|nr:metal-dependent transcriptional regulator [Aggregatilineales bacterium]